jgi:hypothetical protein
VGLVGRDTDALAGATNCWIGSRTNNIYVERMLCETCHDMTSVSLLGDDAKPMVLLGIQLGCWRTSKRLPSRDDPVRHRHQTRVLLENCLLQRLFW